jgi:hypothetical protein
MTPVPLRADPLGDHAPVIHRGLISPAWEIEIMGIVPAFGRLLVMGVIMAAVLIASVLAGVAATTAIAIGIVLAGVVGLMGVSRRPQKLSAAAEIAAMMAPPVVAPAPRLSEPTAVEAMAPPGTASIDPEAGMPRWRRPSLLEARHSDPALQAPVYRLPMRFGEGHPTELDVRVVRYAVVPVLDRPDEVLGLRLSDLASGDEIEVTSASGAFLEVLCPNGERGWIHRTTVGKQGSVGMNHAHEAVPQEADDALTALLSARGMI